MIRGKSIGDMLPLLLCQSPDAQPGQTEGDASNAESAAPHAEHGVLGQDLSPVFLELRSAREITVSS